MDGDSWRDFFVGCLVATVVIMLVVGIASDILCDNIFNAAEATLSEAEIDYLLASPVGNAVVLFATNSGRIVYYDGALFKEME